MARPPFRKRHTESASPGDVIFGANPALEMLRGAPHLVERVYLASGVQIAERVTAEASAHGVTVEVVDRAALDQLAAGGHHQGVAIRAKPFALADVEDLVGGTPSLLVALDGITDPQNLGAIVRSAEVLGAAGVFFPKDRNVGVTPAVVRASSGAAIHLPIAAVVNLARALDDLKRSGYWIVGLAADGSSQFQDLPKLERVVLVIGGEGKGMRPLVARSCDFVVSIPIRGRVASLNAAAAAAIGIHEITARLGS